MDPEDYPSDSDASDEDFRPDLEEANSGSEPEASDVDTEGEDDGHKGRETVGKKRKGKVKQNGSKKRRSTVNGQGKEKETEQPASKDEERDDEEAEKKRTDALWADFLCGTGTSSSTANSGNDGSGVGKSTKPESSKEIRKSVATVPVKQKQTEPERKTVTNIFEFAGEKVTVTEVRATTTNGTENVTSKPPLASGKPSMGASRRIGAAGGGLGSVLSQISKKNELSTLEKSKLDWNSFKRQEGIEEELETHNKGKDGYLERKDFLERADLRQFEQEKAFRQSRRSNR